MVKAIIHIQEFLFFDNFLLIIGVMVFVTLMLFLLAQSMSEDTQEQWTKQDPAFKAATEARLKPAGYAVKTGDAEPVAAAAVAAVEVEQAPRSGADVFNEACAACHVAGVAGAPRLGDTAAWTDRIAKGRDTFYGSIGMVSVTLTGKNMAEVSGLVVDAGGAHNSRWGAATRPSRSTPSST